MTETVKGAADVPGVTEVGDTVHMDILGAPVQASETALEKPLSAETCKLYVAGEPAVTEAEVEPLKAAAREKSVAAPERLMEWGLPAALSVMVRDPVRLPAAVGVKVTLKVQEAAGETVEPQVFVSEKSPVTATLEMVSGPSPVLFRVTDCWVLVVSTGCAEKLSGPEGRETTGMTPLPERTMD